MPLDRTAQAEQLARIFDHAGEPMTFGAIPFAADITAWEPAATDTDRNVGDDTSVLVKVPRSVFGATLPRQGQHFTDGAGRLYRIQAVRSAPPTQPIVQFICGSITPLA